MSVAFDKFSQIINNPMKFRLFLLSKLPAAYFSGVRIVSIDPAKCVTSIRYKWGNQNPFRSIYFASLAMAAEMSTGALSMGYLYKRKPAVSMLVLNMEAEFLKKATGKIFFTCSDGESIQRAVETTIKDGTAQTVKARSEGINENGELVAIFHFTWTFKAR